MKALKELFKSIAQRSRIFFGNIVNSKIFKYIISSLVLLAVSAYLLYHLFFSASDSIVTEVAYPVTDEITVSSDAYIMRNEYVIRSGETNTSAAYYYDDGTKIAKNACIASLYDDGGLAQGNTLIDINNNIDFLEKSNIDKTYMTSDTSNIDSKLTELYYNIRSGLENGNISGVLSNSDDMLTLLNRRMVITGEIDGFDDKIQLLETEREKYESSLGAVTTSIYSDRSGYFYSTCDGYESIFTADAALDMSYDDFIDFTLRSPEDAGSSVIGKIAYDYRWYLVCPVSKSDLKDFTEGRSYEIVFEANGNKRMSLKLVKTVSDTDGDGSLLVFESFDSPSEFSFARMQSVKIIKSSVSGIKVPIGALRVVDGEEGVYILYGSKVYFCTADIIAQNENYYIAAEPDPAKTPYGVLYVYDNIIVSGKDLYAGKVIN